MSENFITCEDCKNLKGPQPGYYYAKLAGGQVCIKECSCHKLWREANHKENLYERSGVATDLTFSSYKGSRSLDDLECLKMIGDDFERFKIRTNFYLYGPNGSQKTSMSKVLGKALIDKGYKVKYMLMDTLMGLLLPTFNDELDLANKKALERLEDVDLLILDETFDKTKVTIYKSGYQLPFLDSFLRKRYDTLGKSTLFISNVSPGEIEAQGFNKSISNFIFRSTCSSCLEFKDIYLNQVGVPNKKALFKRR